MTAGRAGGRDLAVLVALGLGVVALTVWSATWSLAREHPGGYAAVVSGQVCLAVAAAAWTAWRRPPGRWALGIVLVTALAARLVLVPHAPDVSGDINRYVWDGRVQAEGINPYRYSPDDVALVRLRDDEVYPGINRKPVPTIYPPVAEATFFGLHLVGARTVATLKFAFVLIEMLAIAGLAVLLCGACACRPSARCSTPGTPSRSWRWGAAVTSTPSRSRSSSGPSSPTRRAARWRPASPWPARRS